MNLKNYSICNIEGHNDDILNMVCIDENCNNHKLLCCNCIEDHQGCFKPQIKTFVKEFKDQLNPQISEQEQNIENLKAFYDKIQTTIEKAQKKIVDTFQKQINAIKNAKSTIEQFSQQQKTIKVQKQKLQQFESNMTQENFSSLLTEIVDFKPNSDRFSFSLKKTRGQRIDQIQDRISNGSKYSQQYQDFMNKFFEQLENQQLEINLENFFLNAPKELYDQEQNNNNLQQSNMFSQIQTNQIQEQDRQLNTTDRNRNNTNQNNQSPNSKFKQSQNNNFNRSPNNYQIQNSQIPNTQISNIQQSLSDSKQNNNQQSIQINQSPTPQFQKQLQQPFQQNTTKQLPSNSTLPTSYKQQPYPIYPIIQQQQQLQKVASENDNQIELDRGFNLTQGKSFQIESNGKKFSKLLFLSNSVIAGCCGSQFLIFDLTTCQKINEQTVEKDITDVVYMESNDLNGTLFLAIKNGIVLTYKIESKIDKPFNFNDNKQYVVDNKFGNLFIQINKKENQLVSFGEDKIIKVWQLNDFKQINRWELNEAGTVLHLDSEYIYVGGHQFLYVWDQFNQFKKIIKIQQTKIIYINTHLKNLVVGLQDRIIVFERKPNGDYQQIDQQEFGYISSMNIFKRWNIVIVSNTQVKQINQFKKEQQQQVCIHNYKLKILTKLQEHIATCCTVREFDNVYLLGFIYENGWCVIYRIEQTQLQQSK